MILKEKNTKFGLVTLSTAECVEDGGKYQLLCDTHGYLIQDNDKNRLWKWANWPFDWCGACHDENEAAGGFHG